LVIDLVQEDMRQHVAGGGVAGGVALVVLEDLVDHAGISSVQELDRLGLDGLIDVLAVEKTLDAR